MKSAINEKYVNIDFNEGRTLREEYLIRRGVPWKFENLLPYKINVYVYRPTATDLICTLNPRGTASTLKSRGGLMLKAGDAIHVLKPIANINKNPSAQEQIEIARPVYLLPDTRSVKIGDIVYEDRNSFTNGIDISHDMIGLRIHNHLTMPIDVYYIPKNGTNPKGLRIAHIDSDDGTNYMSGSPNSVYLNNEWFGFNVDDSLKFVFSHDQMSYATVKLIDNFTSDVIVGETTQKFVGAFQDMYGYRANEPNIQGLQYFEPVTAYETTLSASGLYGPYGTNQRSDISFLAGGDVKSYGLKNPATGPTHMNILAAGKGVKI